MSSALAVKVQFCKEVGFRVHPSRCLIQPNTSVTVTIFASPMTLKKLHMLNFKVMNPHDAFDKIQSDLISSECFENALKLAIKIELNVLYHKSPKLCPVESLHKLNCPDPRFTFTESELILRNIYKEKSKLFLKHANKCATKNRERNKLAKIHDNCAEYNAQEHFKHICARSNKHIMSPEFIGVKILPLEVDFNRVAVDSETSKHVTIDNKNEIDVRILFLSCDQNCIFYTRKKLTCARLKVPAMSRLRIRLFYITSEIGSFRGHFEYIINDNYKFKHPFKSKVENPQLFLKENNFKFGMVTSEFFITSVPVKITNVYNIDIDFEWSVINTDTPFRVIPIKGTVASDSFLMCNIANTGTVTKSKSHSLIFNSCGVTIEVELVIYTRKVAIKFLESSILFGEIPLNLKTIRDVILENSSKEMVFFCVLEPLMPGLSVSPSQGIVRPKTLLIFTITVQISCIIEFNAEICVRINNKEIISLPISGSVLEPKVLIQPKLLNVPRIPYGLITYVPLVLHNVGSLRSLVQVTDQLNINDYYSEFEICAPKEISGNLRKIQEIILEAGQVSTIYVKLYETDRRAYDIFLPIKINDLFGPPDSSIRGSNNMQYFTQESEKLYTSNPKIKLRTVDREISYCKVTGVFCNQSLIFSKQDIEIDYKLNSRNDSTFSITNVSKSTISITILITKIKPNFSLEVLSEDVQCQSSDTLISFDLNSECEVNLAVIFHPHKMGHFVAVADLYIDKAMPMAYHNLKFVGNYVLSKISPSISFLYFPPTLVGSTLGKNFKLFCKDKLTADNLLCVLEPTDKFVEVKFSNCEQTSHNYSIAVEIRILWDKPYSHVGSLTIKTSDRGECILPISYTFTTCPLTLHASYIIEPESSPFPFYPNVEENPFTKYMNTCVEFLEKWMYQQGFRRELYPVIPDTFNAISSSLVEPSNGSINLSILNFLRRLAGQSAKNLKKINVNSTIDNIEEKIITIHNVYNEVIKLVKRHGGLLGMMQAKYLLKFDDFLVYVKSCSSEQSENDQLFEEELMNNKNSFQRLNKQSWFDLILQCYKVFVFDCCLFDCLLEHEIVLNNNTTDNILLRWLNQVTENEYVTLFSEKSADSAESPCCVHHLMSNFTSDLSDGIAFAAATVHFCPFMKKNLLGLLIVTDDNREEAIIHNALLLLDCWNQLKLYFPIECESFVAPNYLQMLFLTVHLNVILPMLKPRDVLNFNPPLLGSSTRNVSISTGFQESVICMNTLLNNNKNLFNAQKDTSAENGKKTRMIVRYTANFRSTQTSFLLIQCHNKMRVFDTYILFTLRGHVGSLEPFGKYKISCPLYKPIRTDVMISSPFTANCSFRMTLTEEEPKNIGNLPFDALKQPQFLVRRVNLLDDVIKLEGTPPDNGTEVAEQKLILSVICTSAQPGNAWVLFCGDAGEFYIRITTVPRSDSAQDTLQAKIGSWPIDVCSCGEDCECYRTAVLTIPFIKCQTLHSLRTALLENASPTMMEVFDQYIETSIGRLLLSMLLEEHGTNMLEVAHILMDELTYTITSRTLVLSESSVTIPQFTEGQVTLVVHVPIVEEMPDKFLVTFTSECGRDVRTYRVNFYQDERISV